MKRRFVPFAVLAALSGCLEQNRASIEPLAMCFPPAPDTTTGACTYSNTCDKVFGGIFWADVLAVNEAIAVIQVDNQMPVITDPTIGRLNTNDAFIQQYQFEFVLPGSGGTLPSVNMPAMVTVPANSSQLAFVPVLPPDTVLLLRTALGVAGAGNLTVNVRFAGVFGDDRTFVTAPFKVPVDVCSGCFVPPSLTQCPKGYYVCVQAGQAGNYVCKA